MACRKVFVVSVALALAFAAAAEEEANIGEFAKNHAEEKIAEKTERVLKRAPADVLQITISKAHRLQKADKRSNSDPFVVMAVPGGEVGRTQTVRNTQDPQWNRQFQWQFTVGDTLKFTVFDDDFDFGTKKLGEVSLPLEKFHRDGFDGELPLKLGDKDTGATLSISISALNRAPADVLKITISKAQKLQKTDKDWGKGTSDPFVVITVPGGEVGRTQTVQNTQDPQWNRQFQWQYTVGDILKFTVFDDDCRGRTDKLLGEASLTMEEFYPDGFDGELPLKLGGKETKATLSISISALNRRLLLV